MRHGLAITTVIFTLTAGAVRGQMPAPADNAWTTSRPTAPAWSETTPASPSVAALPASADPWAATTPKTNAAPPSVERAEYEWTREPVQPVAWSEPVQAPPSTLGTGGDSFIPPIVMPGTKQQPRPASSHGPASGSGPTATPAQTTFPPVSAYAQPPELSAKSRPVSPTEYPRLDAPTTSRSTFDTRPSTQDLAGRRPRKTYPELHKIWQSPSGDGYSDPLLAPPSSRDRSQQFGADDLRRNRPSLGNLAPPTMPTDSTVAERNFRNLASPASSPLTATSTPPVLAEIPSRPPVVQRQPDPHAVRTASSELPGPTIAPPSLELAPRQLPTPVPAPAPSAATKADLQPTPEFTPPPAARATPSAIFSGKHYALPAPEPCQRWGCKLFGCKHCKPHSSVVVTDSFHDAPFAPEPYCDDGACDFIPGGMGSFEPMACQIFEPYGTAGLWVGDNRVIREGSLVFPFIQDEDSVGLLDFQGEWDDRDAGEFHLGLGYRTFLDPYWIFGTYIYYDLIATEHSNVFHQGRIGLEMLTLNWDFRFAWIFPETGSQGTTATSGISNGTVVTRNSRERAYGGVEAEIGHRFLNWGWNDCFEARWYLGGYYFENSAQGFPSFGGPRGRLELRMYDLGWFGEQSRLELGVETMYDRLREGQIAATIQVRIPFGARGTRDVLSPMRRRLIDPLRYDIQ